MKNNFKYYWFFSVICLLLNACGAGTTETGNPTGELAPFTCDFCYTTDADTGDGSNDVADVTSDYSATGTVLFAICDRVEACNTGVESLDCIENIYTDTNMLESFGGDTTIYDDFEMLQTDIDTSIVTVSASTLDSCASAIEALPCDDVNYNATTESYAGLYLSIPTACESVF